MQRTQLALQFGLALLGIGILSAQIRDGRRLQCLGMAPASVEPRRLASIWSYLACASSVSARAAPLVAGGELLVADQRILGADELFCAL
jgi:hypothetical protein